MAIDLAAVTFDARDAAALAGFWSAVLGRPVDEGAGPYFASISPGGTSQPLFMFIAVPEAPSAKSRTHLDFAAVDQEAEVARVLALGATRVGDHAEHGHEWTVLADPEGNPFCIAKAQGQDAASAP